MEEMLWYRIDASTSEEEACAILREVGKICDRLNEAGLLRSPGMVEDLMMQCGMPVTITRGRDGCYLIAPKED